MDKILLVQEKEGGVLEGKKRNMQLQLGKTIICKYESTGIFPSTPHPPLSPLSTLPIPTQAPSPPPLNPHHFPNPLFSLSNPAPSWKKVLQLM